MAESRVVFTYKDYSSSYLAVSPTDTTPSISYEDTGEDDLEGQASSNQWLANDGDGRYTFYRAFSEDDGDTWDSLPNLVGFPHLWDGVRWVCSSGYLRDIGGTTEEEASAVEYENGDWEAPEWLVIHNGYYMGAFGSEGAYKYRRELDAYYDAPTISLPLDPGPNARFLSTRDNKLFGVGPNGFVYLLSGDPTSPLWNFISRDTEWTQRSLSCLAYDGTSVFIFSRNLTTNKMAWSMSSDLATWTEGDFSYDAIPDDAAFDGTYIWIVDSNGALVRFDPTDQSYDVYPIAGKTGRPAYGFRLLLNDDPYISHGIAGRLHSNDSFQQPVPGESVTLYYDSDSNGSYETEWHTTSTDEWGRYYFGGLPDGDYRVVISLSSQYTAGSAGASATVTVADDSHPDVDFAVNVPTIEGYLFVDVNKDKAFDPSEIGVQPELGDLEMTVDYRYDPVSAGVFSPGDDTQSDPDTGYFRFYNMDLGNYLVGWIPNQFDDFGPSTIYDWVLPMEGVASSQHFNNYEQFDLGPGETKQVYIGLTGITLQGTLYEDIDGDGVIDGGVDLPVTEEVGLADPVWNVSFGSTDTSGDFDFYPISKTYVGASVTVGVNEPGWGTSKTDVRAVEIGDTVTGLTVLGYRHCSILFNMFSDADQDGVLDPGDTLLTSSPWAPGNCFANLEYDADRNGSYETNIGTRYPNQSWTGLRPGPYKVTLSFAPTTPFTDLTAPSSIQYFTLESGDNASALYGYYINPTYSATINAFFDYDIDGVRDGGEPLNDGTDSGLGFYDLYWDEDEDSSYSTYLGTRNFGQSKVWTDLLDGDYRAQIGAWGDKLGDPVFPTNSETQDFTISGGNQQVYFGYATSTYFPAVVEGYVFADYDVDGEYSPPLDSIWTSSPVGVDLVDDSNVVVDTQFTDGSGFFQFTGVVEGTYTVRVSSAPLGYSPGATPDYQFVVGNDTTEFQPSITIQHPWTQMLRFRHGVDLPQDSGWSVDGDVSMATSSAEGLLSLRDDVSGTGASASCEFYRTANFASASAGTATAVLRIVSDSAYVGGRACFIEVSDGTSGARIEILSGGIALIGSTSAFRYIDMSTQENQVTLAYILGTYVAYVNGHEVARVQGGYADGVDEIRFGVGSGSRESESLWHSFMWSDQGFIVPEVAASGYEVWNISDGVGLDGPLAYWPLRDFYLRPSIGVPRSGTHALMWDGLSVVPSDDNSSLVFPDPTELPTLTTQTDTPRVDLTGTSLPSLIETSNSLTIQAWFYYDSTYTLTDSSSYNFVLFSLSTSDTGTIFGVEVQAYDPDSLLIMAISDGIFVSYTVSGFSSYYDGWHLATLVLNNDDSTLKFFIDTDEIASENTYGHTIDFQALSANPDISFDVGGPPGLNNFEGFRTGQSWPGQINEVAIYSDPISYSDMSAMVAAFWNNSRSGHEDIRFDEVSYVNPSDEKLGFEWFDWSETATIEVNVSAEEDLTWLAGRREELPEGEINLTLTPEEGESSHLFIDPDQLETWSRDDSQSLLMKLTVTGFLDILVSPADPPDRFQMIKRRTIVMTEPEVDSRGHPRSA